MLHNGNITHTIHQALKIITETKIPM